MVQLTLITGGARSGKSRHAQQLAEARSGELLYVATAGIGDAEMAARVELHRQARGARWQTLEEPLDLAGTLPAAASGKGAILLDCVTLWLTNLLFARGEDRQQVLTAVDELIALLPELEAPLFAVTNEVGLGIVPENRVARLFRDLAGEANQRLAAAADEVWMVVSGIPLQIK